MEPRRLGPDAVRSSGRRTSPRARVSPMTVLELDRRAVSASLTATLPEPHSGRRSNRRVSAWRPTSGCSRRVPPGPTSLDWPPDVFAFTNLVLGHTEAYRFAVAPPRGTRWPPSPAWNETVTAAAGEWRELAAHPLRWSAIRGSSALGRRSSGTSGCRSTTFAAAARAEVWEALLTLHAIADEACAGLAGSTSEQWPVVRGAGLAVAGRARIAVPVLGGRDPRHPEDPSGAPGSLDSIVLALPRVEPSVHRRRVAADGTGDPLDADPSHQPALQRAARTLAADVVGGCLPAGARSRRQPRQRSVRVLRVRPGDQRRSRDARADGARRLPARQSHRHDRVSRRGPGGR